MADAKAPAVTPATEAAKPDPLADALAALTESKAALWKAQEALRAAPSVTEVLARPMVYEAWLKKVQDALNG